MCIIPKSTHIFLELNTFKASIMEHYLIAILVGPSCQQQAPFVHWAFLCSTWACWKQTVDFHRIRIANKLAFSG